MLTKTPFVGPCAGFKGSRPKILNAYKMNPNFGPIPANPNKTFSFGKQYTFRSGRFKALGTFNNIGFKVSNRFAASNGQWHLKMRLFEICD